MRGYGILATELIKLLKAEIKEHGDHEVWIPSRDYPEGVSGIHFRTEPDNGYYPTRIILLK